MKSQISGTDTEDLKLYIINRKKDCKYVPKATGIWTHNEYPDV